MTATAPPQPARRGRWLKIALVASLAVNLLLIGAAAAAFVRHRIMAAAALGGYSANLLGYAQSMPPQRRGDLWRATRDERRSMQPLRAEVRAARSEWREALAANPFDKERFARAQSRLLEAENRARAEAQRLFLAIAAQLTPEERAQFLRWQARDGHAPARGGWWRRNGPQPRDGDGETSGR